jgi:ribosomal protein S18 acetylase RimI-like enzyme
MRKTDERTIRPLTEADAGQYWPLRLRALREEVEAFGSSYEEQCDRGEDVVVARLREQTSGNSFVLGAFLGDELVGIVAFGRETALKMGHKAEVYQVYVAPEARGLGLGRQLMEALLARGRETPGVEQVLLAVSTTQEAARALYASIGFESYGVERRALKLPDGKTLDEELMVCWLVAPPAERQQGRDARVAGQNQESQSSTGPE